MYIIYLVRSVINVIYEDIVVLSLFVMSVL